LFAEETYQADRNLLECRDLGPALSTAALRTKTGMPVFSSHLADCQGLGLGQRLREERQARKLTLGDVSQRTGLSIAWLSQIEPGLVVLDFETLVRIAGAFGVTPDVLLPEERSFPYQITRDAEVRSRSARRSLVLSESGELDRTHEFWPPADLFVGRHIEPLLARLANTPESRLRYCYHDEVEFVFVLQGEMEFRMRTPEGEAVGRLHHGDCLIFRADMPHFVRSPHPELCESLHVFAGPSRPFPTAWDWYSPHARGFSIDGESKRREMAGPFSTCSDARWGRITPSYRSPSDQQRMLPVEVNHMAALPREAVGSSEPIPSSLK
jgi:transcriptional regulator with XRE-family HTH domain